ncbi:putative DNA repair protein (RadC) [Streptococcus infantarius subsp. infantarius]|uniref:RadC family protein n=1 Tax=Streptococcus infantarius TaxID=102684 RepID=UPI00208F7484|nr:DNA repair protein RadC [Streptococcus infantarius]MCO4489215.1 putative DNA repair protein (RadC) [Streptococcus infantarius subsp. infantarius]MCO4489720.1 putative DNA repair protein (RadC) [Streptococcus infantarius subsp. infantarius]MCO4492185.1 putative DNA repair protein (RadC) [Streptococcus infantarius subsp. infantarius]MCO4506803.1 putative DNA repair protein (RadC) [Streptococcus infantarius subsp. infantarius]MCO4510478.1 putative DNA repair protein (RadC) [Streptococcus infan
MYSIEMKADAMLPRERLRDLGAEQLSNQELLSILLRTGTKTRPVLEVANDILKHIDTLADFQHLSLQELQKIKGIGYVKSIEIKAMIELAKRISKAEYVQKERIMSSERLARKMMLELSDQKQEHLVAIYLDTQNRIIEQRTIFIGSVRRSIAEPREILYYACKNMATSVIIIHNHPSGSPAPSENDLRFTEKMKRACDDIGIVCLDHIIVGKYQYYSFREETDVL